jgi:hypothetical protein
MVNRYYFISNHLAYGRCHQKSLSLSITFHASERNHDVEPSGGRSSLTTRLINHSTPPLLSSHPRPSPRCLPLKNPVCLCPPLTTEVRNASRQPPTAPCTLYTGCPSSCFSLTNRGRNSAAPLPLIW